MRIEYRAQNRIEELEKLAEEYKRKIHNLPAGRIECIKRGNGYRWYVVKNKERKTLKKSDVKQARRLAYKRYIYDELEDVEAEIAILNTFVLQMKMLREGKDPRPLLNKFVHLERDGRARKDNEEVLRLAKEYIEETEPEIKKWETDYEQMEDFNDSRKIRAKSGIYYHSKDEIIIDDILHEHGLLVRHDEKLPVGGKYEYPDFHILDPKTGKTLYWEHFGMMDDITYRERTIKKLSNYLRNGYYPGLNFVATFMSEPYRIDAQMIETIIEYFFD